MKLRKSVGIIAALASMVLGCADNNESLYIMGNAVPDSACRLVANENMDRRGSGSLDIVMGTKYIMHALIKNDMPSSLKMNSFTEKDGRMEAHHIFLKKATITYTYDPRIILPGLDTREVLTSGFVSAAGGLAVVDIEIISPDMAQRFATKLPSRDTDNPEPRATMTVDVQVIGETGDGTEVKSNVFTYPITICRGCLLMFPTEADNPNSPNFDCDLLSGSLDDEPCNIGQDDPVDCRLCKRRTPMSERKQCDPL